MILYKLYKKSRFSILQDLIEYETRVESENVRHDLKGKMVCILNIVLLSVTFRVDV